MNRENSVLRTIACDSISGNTRFTQLGLADRLNLSLSLINRVIKKLENISAIRINRRSFEVISLNRLLMFWATHRNLNKDIVYSARVDLPVTDIERSLPDEIAFTGYSAYKLLYDETPSDYSEVYVYATDIGLEEIKRRFPSSSSKIPNLFVLKCDQYIQEEIREHRLERSSVCRGQLFVDLWNMNEWYSKEFVQMLTSRLGI
ncbi:MAG: hypothetical protein ACP5UZ_08290 [Thermoplasmata archaeon]